MKNIINSLSSSDKEIEDIFFNRPVNRALTPPIGLVLSNNLNLNTVNKIYTTLLSMGQNIVMVGDEKLSDGLVPLEIKLKSRDKLRYQNADEGVQALSGCKIVIVLAGRELNSAMELFLNRLCDVYQETIITDFPKLFNKTKFEGYKLYLLDNKSIGADRSAGINKLLELMSDYSRLSDAAIAYFSSKQILASDYRIEGSACVINSANEVDKNEFAGILASLLIDKKNPLDHDWLRYCQAAGFLYRIYQKDGSEGVKKYLNEKF